MGITVPYQIVLAQEHTSLMNQELRHIATLIRQRQTADARRALGRYLETHPDSAEAWYLLSGVGEKAADRLRAAQKAAALDPTNAKYGQRLARLMNAGAAPRSSRRRVWLLAVPLLLILIAAGVMWLAQGLAQPVVLPTQAVFVLSALQPPTEPPPPTNIVLPTRTPEAAAETAVPITTRAPSLPTGPTHTAPPPTSRQRTADSTATMTAAGPILPTVTPLSSPTRTPASAAPTAAATSAPPFPTVVIVDAVPLRAAGQISGGELRVIDVFRRAGAEIVNRGGSAIPAPAGAEWVLLELLLICDGETNCAPDSGSFAVAGSSGTLYPPGAGLRLEPLFGPQMFAAGQVWGYMAFVVQTSESSLWLALGQGAERAYFALQ